MPGLSPLLDDDDHRSQKQNQDDQAADAGPEDQPHVLGMLGDLQRPFGVLTGGWKRPESSGYPDVLNLKARFLLRQQLIITAFNAASDNDNNSWYNWPPPPNRGAGKSTRFPDLIPVGTSN